MQADKTERENSVWCLVGNIRHDPQTDGNSEAGFPKVFKEGSKIYCWPLSWGDGLERMRVIGMHRSGSRYVTYVVKTKMLRDLRVKKIFNPYLLSLLKTHWDDSDRSFEKAARIKDILSAKD